MVLLAGRFNLEVGNRLAATGFGAKLQLFLETGAASRFFVSNNNLQAVSVGGLGDVGVFTWLRTRKARQGRTCVCCISALPGLLASLGFHAVARSEDVTYIEGVPPSSACSGALSMSSMNWSSFGVMMICVRRLRCLPTEVELSATGLYSPRPAAERRLGSMP